jgi:hypothetical protein
MFSPAKLGGILSPVSGRKEHSQKSLSNRASGGLFIVIT